MAHIGQFVVVNINEVSYRVKNENTEGLPREFKNVCIEIEEGVKVTDWMLKNSVGLFIINTTGYTPENFKFEINKKI